MAPAVVHANFSCAVSSSQLVRPFSQFCERALVGLKSHKTGRVAKALSRRCISWWLHASTCVQTPCANPSGIMCLLDDEVVGVQASRQEPLEESAAHPSCGSCSADT